MKRCSQVVWAARTAGSSYPGGRLNCFDDAHPMATSPWNPNDAFADEKKLAYSATLPLFPCLLDIIHTHVFARGEIWIILTWDYGERRRQEEAENFLEKRAEKFCGRHARLRLGASLESRCVAAYASPPLFFIASSPALQVKFAKHMSPKKEKRLRFFLRAFGDRVDCGPLRSVSVTAYSKRNIDRV